MMENVYDQTGRIFDIQRYSLHDGPGIRTIVFFKGCHLRCRWCCNPESQEYGIQTMNMNGTTKTVGRDVTVRELMSDLEKDRVYYERSGGGITLSGGECMAQPDFAEALLIACHRYGLTTAIETTAFADRAVVERLIPHVDYVLMDIKHMDPAKHRAFTGQSNEQILSNARFAASLPGVRALHLLPYHRLGQDKYAGIGREYTLASLTPPTNEQMAALKAAAEAASHLHVQIGG